MSCWDEKERKYMLKGILICSFLFWRVRNNEEARKRLFQDCFMPGEKAVLEGKLMDPFFCLHARKKREARKMKEAEVIFRTLTSLKGMKKGVNPSLGRRFRSAGAQKNEKGLRRYYGLALSLYGMKKGVCTLEGIRFGNLEA